MVVQKKNRISSRSISPEKELETLEVPLSQRGKVLIKKDVECLIVDAGTEQEGVEN